MVDVVNIATPPTGPDAPQTVVNDVNASAGAQSQPERPSWLPDQFKTPEDLAASYKELQSKFTQSRQTAQTTPEVPVTEGSESKPDRHAGEEEAAKEVAASVGLDLSEWSDEFSSTGDVSEEGRSKIAESLKSVFGDKAREVVDQFVDSKRSLKTYADQQAENERKMLLEPLGGEDGFSKMASWATQGGLSPDEVTALNVQLDSDSRQARAFALETLKSRYEAANGRPAKLIGGTIPSASSDTFTSTAQLTAAINDPRYSKDPAYRASIEAKLARSNIL